MSTLFLIITFVTLLYGIKLFSKSVTNKFDTSIPKKHAIAKAKEHKELIYLIGKNIVVKKDVKTEKRKGRFSLSLNTDGFDLDEKEIDLKLNLIGEKDKALLKVVAYKKEGKWIYKEMYALIPSLNKKINLL